VVTFFLFSGLQLRNLTNSEILLNNIKHQAPPSLTYWELGWLSCLASGDSVKFVFHYTFNSPVNPGEYEAQFEFPGFHYQISKDQLFQPNGRIWMGNTGITKNIEIN
jgi:hypothetical protein